MMANPLARASRALSRVRYHRASFSRSSWLGGGNGNDDVAVVSNCRGYAIASRNALTEDEAADSEVSSVVGNGGQVRAFSNKLLGDDVVHDAEYGLDVDARGSAASPRRSGAGSASAGTTAARILPFLILQQFAKAVIHFVHVDDSRLDVVGEPGVLLLVDLSGTTDEHDAVVLDSLSHLP